MIFSCELLVFVMIVEQRELVIMMIRIISMNLSRLQLTIDKEPLVDIYVKVLIEHTLDVYLLRKPVDLRGLALHHSQ